MSNIIHLPISSSAKILVSVRDNITPKTVIAKFDPEKNLETIHIAKLLHVSNSQIGKYIKKTIGEKIAPGDILAEKKGIFSYALVKSPIKGKLAGINLSSGTLNLVKYTPEKEEISLPLSGNVVFIGKSGIELEVSNELVRCTTGEGDDVIGNLKYLPDGEVGILTSLDETSDTIVLCKSAHEISLLKFQVIGVLGVIMLKKVDKISLSCVQVNENIFKKLVNFTGKKIWLRPSQKQIVILD